MSEFVVNWNEIKYSYPQITNLILRLNDGQNNSIVLGIESGFKELKLSVKEMYEEYQEYKCVDSEKRLQVAKNYIVLICEMEEFLK